MARPVHRTGKGIMVKRKKKVRINPEELTQFLIHNSDAKLIHTVLVKQMCDHFKSLNYEEIKEGWGSMGDG